MVLSIGSESRDIFAFEWEDPERGRKQQYWWTVLAQGFTESPNWFGQTLEQILEHFRPPEGALLLQDVGDLVLSGSEKVGVKRATNELLNFLGKQGLRVSKNKPQSVEREAKSLGHLVSEGKYKITPGRIQGVIELPMPRTKRELRKFLGVVGYCRLWIEAYAQNIKG